MSQAKTAILGSLGNSNIAPDNSQGYRSLSYSTGIDTSGRLSTSLLECRSFGTASAQGTTKAEELLYPRQKPLRLDGPRPSLELKEFQHWGPWPLSLAPSPQQPGHVFLDYLLRGLKILVNGRRSPRSRIHAGRHLGMTSNLPAVDATVGGTSLSERTREGITTHLQEHMQRLAVVAKLGQREKMLRAASHTHRFLYELFPIPCMLAMQDVDPKGCNVQRPFGEVYELCKLFPQCGTIRWFPDHYMNLFPCSERTDLHSFMAWNLHNHQPPHIFVCSNLRLEEMTRNRFHCRGKCVMTSCRRLLVSPNVR